MGIVLVLLPFGIFDYVFWRCLDVVVALLFMWLWRCFVGWTCSGLAPAGKVWSFFVGILPGIFGVEFAHGCEDVSCQRCSFCFLFGAAVSLVPSMVWWGCCLPFLPAQRGSRSLVIGRSVGPSVCLSEGFVKKWPLKYQIVNRYSNKRVIKITKALTCISKLPAAIRLLSFTL